MTLINCAVDWSLVRVGLFLFIHPISLPHPHNTCWPRSRNRIHFLSIRTNESDISARRTVACSFPFSHPSARAFRQPHDRVASNWRAYRLLPLRYLPLIRNALVNHIIAIEPVSSQDATAWHFCWDSGVPLHNAPRISNEFLAHAFHFSVFFFYLRKNVTQLFRQE